MLKYFREGKQGEQTKTFGSERNVCYLDCDYRTGEYICQAFSNCALYVDTVYCTPILPQKSKTDWKEIGTVRKGNPFEITEKGVKNRREK